MKLTKNMIASVCFIVSFLMLGLSSTLYAQEADTLVKDINSGLRSAQRTMFSGKYDEASEELNVIRKQLDELKSIDPQNKQIGNLERKYEKYVSDINRRIDKNTGSPSKDAVTSPAQSESEPQLPGGAKRYLRQIEAAIQKAQRVLDNKGPSSTEYRLKQAHYEMQSAESAWSDLSEKYPQAADHPESVQAKANMDKMFEAIDSYGADAKQKAQANDDAAALREKESNEWIEQFNIYVQSDSDKYFISGYTEQAEDMNKRMQLFAELSTLFNEYQDAAFSEGKTDELLAIEKSVARDLETFRNELISGAERHIDEADMELDRATDFLAQNEKRTEDNANKPLLLNDLSINSIARKISWAASLLPGDERIAELETRFEELKKQQSIWREKMIESTVMLPDTFSGAQAQEIKDMAIQIIKKLHPSANILRTNIISSDWAEERVLEFTDTTQSAVQYRVTRSVSVQVAANNSGDTFLYTVYVASDLRSDGSWGHLYGHIMFTDRMLEENVKEPLKNTSISLN